MKNELQTVIKMVEKDGEYFVSSKEVAKKFGKRHDHVLRDIDSLQLPENFKLPNFGEGVEMDSNGINQRVFYMTKDGFSILAFGFSGKNALIWKLAFLEAFNKMEQFIKANIPFLQAKIETLEKEKKALLIEQTKKPHPLKNTVLVPHSVNTLFGPEIEYHRVKRDDNRYSDLSYKEGELKRLSQCVAGMAKKIDWLAREVAIQRRN